MYQNRKSDLQAQEAPEVDWYQMWAAEYVADLRAGGSRDSVRERFPGSEADFLVVEARALRIMNRQQPAPSVSSLFSLRRVEPKAGHEPRPLQPAAKSDKTCSAENGDADVLPREGSDRGKEVSKPSHRSATKQAAHCLRQDHGFLYAEDYVTADGLLCAMAGTPLGGAEDIVQRILATWVSRVGRQADITARGVFSSYVKALPAALVAGFLLEQRMETASVDVQSKYHAFLLRMKQSRAGDERLQGVRDALKFLKKAMTKHASRSRRDHVKVIHTLVEGWNAFAEGRTFESPGVAQGAPYGVPAIFNDLGGQETL